MTRAAAAFLAVVIFLFVGITVAKQGRGRIDLAVVPADSSPAARERVLRFWDRYRDATRHRTAGRTREAAAAYAQALALDGRHEDALYYSGSMLFELGDFSGAQAAWRGLVEVNESSARAHSRLGDLYLCYDRPRWFDLSAAEVQFQRAAEINAEETGPLLRLGEIALVAGNLAGAQAKFDDVLRTHSRSVEANLLRGYIAWKTGDTAEAAARAARLAEVTRASETEDTGLNEGDTESGAAMVARPEVCGGVRDLVASLGTAAAPVTGEQITTLYRRADTLVTEARRKVH